MAKDPAFLFYSKDWIEGTAEYMPEEKGVYIDLLCFQHQRGGIPNDIERLAKMVGLSIERFQKIWNVISNHFEPNGEPNGDRLVNRKLNKVMKERSEKSKINTITGTFASLLRQGNFDKKIYNYLKSNFKVENYINIPKENITERLTEWLNECLKSIEDENEDGNEIKDKEKKKEYPQELIDLNERCKVYFDEKYVNEKSLECFNVLVNKGYAISDIKKAILNGRNDDFWSKQFQSPLKLNKKDKCDVLFIDVFLKLKQNNNVNKENWEYGS